MTDQEKAVQWIAANRGRIRDSRRQPNAVASLVVLIAQVRADERERVAKGDPPTPAPGCGCRACEAIAAARGIVALAKRDEAELGEVSELLAAAPEGDALGRMSLESRQNELRRRLGR